MYPYYNKPWQNQTVISRKLVATFSCPKRGKHSESFSIMQKLFECPRRYPVLRGMASYGLIWPVCSLVQEYVVHGTTLQNADWARAARYSLFGCFAMAPVWHIWMKLSGRLFLTKDLTGALKRAAFEQVAYAPITLAFFFFGMSALENKPFRACANEVKEKFWPTYTVGAMYWPLAQTLNFYYVSDKNRMLCVSAASFVWTIFMAHMKEKEPKMAEFGLPPEDEVTTIRQVVRPLKTITNPVEIKSGLPTFDETVHSEKIIKMESEEIVESKEALSDNSEVTGQAGDSTESDNSMELYEQHDEAQGFVVKMPFDDFGITHTVVTSKDTVGPTETNTAVPIVPSEDDEDKPDIPGESGDFSRTDEMIFAGYVNNTFKSTDNDAATENLNNDAIENLDESMQFKLKSVRGVDLLEASIAMESRNRDKNKQKDGPEETITHVYDIKNTDEISIEKTPPEDVQDADDNGPEVALPVTETIASKTGVIIQPVAPDTITQRRCIKGCDKKTVETAHEIEGLDSGNTQDNNVLKRSNVEFCWWWV